MMQAIDLATAGKLIDFSGGDSRLEALGKLQLRGAVALTNMIANPAIGMGYLADEVGMGKTYVALGTIAMMRYFNPALRVLYICPSTNVQEKWAEREHPNFIKTNVISNHFRIRTPDGRSGTPSISCSNIESLINAATSGYYGDIFVRMTSFSMGMGSDEEQLQNNRDRLLRQVPTSVLGDISLVGLCPDTAKAKVKEAYARAVNYLLPTFDLVVIDEAHNFKHDFESSDRNRALSRILGFYGQSDGYRRRAKNALLLSATPYDLNPTQLFNQLRLVGKESLMPAPALWNQCELLQKSLQTFMVRRLNELEIQGATHTRNMYRREWRKGERVEMGFETDEHKLVTALVQKHVGDLLDRDRGIPSFQMGMLASFESYAQTAVKGHPAFDGDEDLRDKTEARDGHAIDGIRQSYIDANLGQSLPHPKMDQASRSLAEQAFDRARKQLVFVRRVKSVNELKEKLDDEYNAWLTMYIQQTLPTGSSQLVFMQAVLDVYHTFRKHRDENIAGVETNFNDDEGESVPPKNDTFFSWFFRGDQPKQLAATLSAEHQRWPTPDSVRTSLIEKNGPSALLFEFSWVAWFARYFAEESLDVLLESVTDESLEALLLIESGVAISNRAAAYLVSQIVFLKILEERYPDHRGWLGVLIEYLRSRTEPGDQRPVSNAAEVLDTIEQPTFFSLLSDRGLEARFFASAPDLACDLKRQSVLNLETRFHRLEVHRQLLAQALRSGHGVIDLYLARLELGHQNLDNNRSLAWIEKFCERLANQPLEPDAAGSGASNTPFSTAIELNRLSDNLDLVIKNNLPAAYNIKPKALRRQLNYDLPPGAPIIGANGQTTSNRSSQARKFRMPGYPLVLISTDVFQEGEDLHTFCDSVVHYGLSSSPVSIEQKTGRVDRVGAFAHRRLLSPTDNKLSDDDYIQVRFPFVKQSIEAIQVRQMCRNLNDFIRSLHTIGDNNGGVSDEIDAENELMDRDEIPDQIIDRLSSPYDPPMPENTSEELSREIETQEGKTRTALAHVQRLIDSVHHKTLANEFDNQLEIDTRSARSCGEMLVSISQKQPLEEAVRPVADWTAQAIRKRQAELYESSLARTYGVRENNGLALYQDSEVLVGGTDITCKNDILGAFDRLEKNRVARNADASPLTVDLAALKEYAHQLFSSDIRITKRTRKFPHELTVQFNSDFSRRHGIRVEHTDGFAKFEAIVASDSTVKDLDRLKLLEYTWLRNRNIDLVEILVAPNGNLVGRSFHPIASLGIEEFAFNALVLAAEADRVEYLIKEPDEY